MKATITNAVIDQKTNTCYVTYSTGTEKMYPADKLPKTVQAWLADHEELAVEEAEPTAPELAKSLPSSLPSKEPVKVDISMILPRRTEMLQKQFLAMPVQKITAEDTDPARAADMMREQAVEELAFIGHLAIKALAFVAEATLWSSVLLIQSIGKSLIAWLAIALPEAGKLIADLALWAWAAARRDLPVWARDTAKPALAMAYRATAAGAVRAYHESAVVLEIFAMYARIMVSKAVIDEYDATLWTANEQRVWA